MDLTGNKTKPLRFGIMCSSLSFAAWQVRAIRLLTDQHCIPALLIVDDRQAEIRKWPGKAFDYPYKNLLYRLYVRYVHRPASIRMVCMEEELAGVPAIRCRIIKKVYSEYFTAEDVTGIKEYDLDFILRFGFNIIRGDILFAARFGVWSFHHGDERQFRGGPPGFWEIMHRSPVTGAIFQQLTERLDAGNVLRRGYFRTIRHSWSGSVDQLFFETAHWPAQVAAEIMRQGLASLDYPLSDTGAPVYKYPRNGAMLWFFLIQLAARCRFHYDDLFRAEKWTIGFVPSPIGDFLNNRIIPDPIWMKPCGAHRYAADPFAIGEQDGLKVFFESYDYRTAKGTIAMSHFNRADHRYTSPVGVLDPSYHLAYPFMVNINDTWYCIPESAENKTVDLYRWDKTDQSMRFVSTLISGLDAVDATLFSYGDYWWLFFCRKNLSDTHLYAAFAKEFTGPYTMHPGNPVKTDVRSARPAGTPFDHNGFLYRPAQDCSRTYGGRIVLHKIMELSPDTFLEVPVRAIDPFRNTTFCLGIHTLAQAGGGTVVDGKKYVFDSCHFRRRLAIKMRRVIH